MNKKSLWTDIKFMLILSFICGLLLGGTNFAIGKKGEISPNTISTIFSITNTVFKQNSIYEQFESEYEQLTKGRIKLWRSKKNTSIIACEATGSGMWNEITIVFVISLLDQHILGLQVTEEKETAGLGSKIREEDFTSQFTDKRFKNEVKVDAITGASTSSLSVEKLLNKALLFIRQTMR